MRPVRSATSLSLASLLAAVPGTTLATNRANALDPALGGVAVQDLGSTGSPVPPADATPSGNPASTNPPASTPPAPTTPPSTTPPAAPATTPPAAPAITPTVTPADAPKPTDAQRAVVEDRLARALAARARIVLQRELVFLGILRNSKALMQEAVDRAPENTAILRLAIDLASVLEEGDADSAAWLSEGLARLSRLEPDDEVLRLRRLLDAIDRRQTAEGRVEASRSLLTPESIDRIGNRVAARIAFDLAMLLRRTGDNKGFEENLLRALDLDPFFPEAAEIAAGYFRMSAPTVVDEVRALRGAMLANPMQESIARGLAELCLRHGAYQVATSILEIEVRLHEARGVDADYDAMLADLCIALWGAGRPDVAFILSSQRQSALDRVLHQEIERQGMTMTLEERSKAHLPASPQFATTIAAMASAESPKTADIAVGNAVFSFESQIEQMTKRKEGAAAAPVDPAVAERVAELALECAMVQLWLGGKVDKAQAMLSRAAEFGPLSDAARARFDGWAALRRKDAATAKSMLAPLAEADLVAKLGLALAHEELGERKDAARILLEVARATPETAMGLWARARLWSIVGGKPVIMPGAAEIEQAAELPAGFAKVMRDGGNSMLLRVIPRQNQATAWDQLLFDIELINRSAWPLAVGPDGPIKDTSTVSASIHVPGEMPFPPQIVLVPIDRQFLIPPGETLRIPVDLSVTDASAALREDALSGAFVSLHAIINWRTTLTGFEPSQLGVEVESAVVHVSGERITREWVERALTQLRDRSQVPNPEYVALLSGALVRRATSPAMVPEDAAKALDAAGEVVADAALRLWPEARAWLIFACPKGKRVEESKQAQERLDVGAAGGVEPAAAVPELEALDAVLRGDETPVVRKAWIAVRSRRPEDPVIAASLESAHADVRAFAADCRQWMIEARDERAKQLNLKK